MARKPGRPPADEVSEGAAKQIMDVKKIVPPDDDSTAQLLNRANTLLETTAKSSLLQAAVSSAKKAEIMSRRELEELQNEDRRGSQVTTKLGGGMSADDIRTVAETLPESQREGFIRQAMGIQNAMAAPNPMMSAWFQSKATNSPQQPVSGQAPAMSLNDTIQAMMGMMMMQNQMQQQRAAEWREQQEYLEKQHQRRLEELREARGETMQNGPSPEVEAMKLQLEFYRDTLKENQALVKDLMAKQANPDGESELRKELIALTKQNLEDQRAALDSKIRGLESKIGDASRFNLNIHEMMKQANDNGANLRMGDSTDLQLANEHEYKMRQLEQQAAKDDREYQIRMAESAAKMESARAQQDAIKMILTEVGGAIVQSKLSPPQPLSNASNNVKSIVGVSK